VIDAPAALIKNVIVRNSMLERLFDNGGMLLWCYDGNELLQYERE
jgi:hypothetical protein